MFFRIQALFGPDTKKLTRITTTILEDEDDDQSLCSSRSSSSNRINSIDSNLADEIMSELGKPPVRRTTPS